MPVGTPPVKAIKSIGAHPNITPLILSDPRWKKAFIRFKIAFDFYICTESLFLGDANMATMWTSAKRPARELFETALIGVGIHGELFAMYSILV
jgi:hypothetical protein